MAGLKDLTGQQFGRLTVIARAENNAQGSAQWLCKCSCGNPEYKIVRSTHLISGSVKSCGCLMKEAGNILNQRFGKLVVVSKADDKIANDGVHITMWNCRCDCGNMTVVDTSSLKSGHTKSCGCLQGEHHNDATHKEGRTRLYRIWNNIKQRCLNPNNSNFKNYGGRGITVCDIWLNSYIAFKEWALNNGYSDNLSIDRINVNGDYEPNNCRWVTQKMQNNNTRSNKKITFNGETLTLAQWRERLGFKRGVLEYRLNNGWDLEKAFLTPSKQH